MGNNKSGILLVAAGNSYFINCKVVVLSPKSLHVSLSLSQCNHIPYTTGFQSNLMHRYSLIKLICGDAPHLPFCPQSIHASTYTKMCSTFSLAAPQSAQMPPGSQNVTLNYFLISTIAAVPRPMWLPFDWWSPTLARQWTADREGMGFVKIRIITGLLSDLFVSLN